MGHSASFCGKEKEGRQNFQGCSTGDCAHLLQCCHQCAHVRACDRGQVFSGGVQLFYTGIPAHLATRLGLGVEGLAATHRRSGKIKDYLILRTVGK